MRMALLRAEQAAEQGEIPVGAVLVAPDGATVLACTGNLTHTRRNPVAHAELLAVSEAAERLGGWRLLGTTLYCTLEPCPMCERQRWASAFPAAGAGIAGRWREVAGGASGRCAVVREARFTTG